jgi:hypothetical protein
MVLHKDLIATQELVAVVGAGIVLLFVVGQLQASYQFDKTKRLWLS